MDKEEITVHLQELDKLSILVEKPLNSNIGNKSDPEQLIEYLVEDSMNVRRYATRLVKIARFFSTQFENSQIKTKELKKRNTFLISKLEETTYSLEMTEKTLANTEEKVEYLSKEIEDLEKVLGDSIKEKDSVKKDLSSYKKLLKEKEAQELSQSKSEKISISYIKEESSKKISELNLEVSKKVQAIENLTQTIKSFEGKLANEKTNNEMLRNQNSNLKNDLFTLNSRLSELKTKNFSNKEKIRELEVEVVSLAEQKEEISKSLEEFKVKEKSFADIETEDQTLEMAGKRTKGKSEALSDFFVTEEIEELEEYETEGDGLVYFISNPGFSYPKIYNLTVDCGEGINIVSPKFQSSKFEFSQKCPKTPPQSPEGSLHEVPLPVFDFEIGSNKQVLGFKEPVKEYFIKIVQDIKSKSPIREKLLKIPTNKLYSSLVKDNIAMCYWPEVVLKYLMSKIA